jgi:hypothetical protein
VRQAGSTVAGKEHHRVVAVVDLRLAVEVDQVEVVTMASVPKSQQQQQQHQQRARPAGLPRGGQGAVVTGPRMCRAGRVGRRQPRTSHWGSFCVPAAAIRPLPLRRVRVRGVPHAD